MPERIVILGAAGIVGQGISRRLAADGGFDLLLADMNRNAVRDLGDALAAESVQVDVADAAGLAHVLRDCRLAVNATLYYQNLAVMEGCLASNSSYVDLGGLYRMTLEQLNLGRRFEEAGLLAVLGAGKAPGITNVLAARGADRFERLSEVHLRSGRRALDPCSDVTLPYSAQTLLDEFTLPPMVLEAGTLREVRPLSGHETVSYPSPFGEIDYVTTLHSELATLPSFLGRGLRSMDFKVGLSKATTAAFESLVRLGFASSEPLEVGGRTIRPRDLSVTLLSKLPTWSGPEVWLTEVEIRGESGGKPRRTVLQVRGTDQQNGTSLAAAATVRLFAQGFVTATGVRAPESALPSQAFLTQLQAYGLSYVESDGDPLAAPSPAG